MRSLYNIITPAPTITIVAIRPHWALSILAPLFEVLEAAAADDEDAAAAFAVQEVSLHHIDIADTTYQCYPSQLS